MSPALDPIISEFSNEEEAASHDRWFRASVLEALQSTKPLIPHDQVMAEVEARIASAEASRRTLQG